MSSEQHKPSGGERLARLGRDINALGALAVGSLAALIPGPNVILAGWATLNVVQAGGFELWRQHEHSKQTKQSRQSGKS